MTRLIVLFGLGLTLGPALADQAADNAARDVAARGIPVTMPASPPMTDPEVVKRAMALCRKHGRAPRVTSAGVSC